MHTHTKTTKFCLVSASCWVAGSGCEGKNSPSPDPNTLEESNTDGFIESDIDGTVVDDSVTAGKDVGVVLEYTN